MTPVPRIHRSAFTLIELLVVIAVLATLSAIAAGTYFRVRSAQQYEAAEQVVTKVQSALQQAWTAELENARDAFVGRLAGYGTPVERVRNIAGNDTDRALALWYYLWMKNAFPQNFYEATTDVTMTVAGYSVVIPRRPYFLSPPLPTISEITDPNDPASSTNNQSAVLLYRILTQRGPRGQYFDTDAVGSLQKSLVPNNSNTNVLTETYGSPIIFVRMATNDEIRNSPDFMKKGEVSRDPFDPKGRLLAAKPNVTPAVAIWNSNMGNDRITAATAVGMTAPADFISRNWLPTVISKGGNSVWPLQLPATPNMSNPAALVVLDDDPQGMIFGYKTRRQGARSDQ